MSVLETPRIYFGGEISWDPIVTNNDPANYNENTAETTFVSVRDFRAKAVEQVVTGGNWNPHGTHRSSLFDTFVSGYDLGDGLRTDDPFVRKPVALTGMLVDLEPYGASTSQLFFDSLQIGVRGAERISAKRGSRFVARYVNFTRNPSYTMIAGRASVIWQTSFPTDGLDVDPSGSPVLDELTRSLARDDVLGLTVRFSAYRTVYFDDKDLREQTPELAAAETALRDKLRAGGFQPNPTRSLLVGVVGLWRRGEPAQEPGDRALLPTSSSMAGAHALVDGRNLVLDLGNSVPEDPTAEDELAKKQLGTLTVVATDPAGQLAPETVGTIDHDAYARPAYEASAGLVTLPLAEGMPEKLATRNLRIRQADGTVLLSEARYRAVPLTPCLYLDEGPAGQADFQVYDRGRLAGADVAATLYQLGSDGQVHGSWAVATNEQGRLSHTVLADGGKIVTLVPAFTPAETPVPGRGANPQVNTYLAVRVLPADPAVAALPPTWDNVYTHVLANWNAMAPCMDNWLRLDDPEQVRAHSAVLKRLTDPAASESYRFMPVTRDMTAGERTLLYRFLDAPGDDQPPPQPAADEVRPSFVELGRSLRGG